MQMIQHVGYRKDKITQVAKVKKAASRIKRFQNLDEAYAFLMQKKISIVPSNL